MFRIAGMSEKTSANGHCATATPSPQTSRPMSAHSARGRREPGRRTRAAAAHPTIPK